MRIIAGKYKSRLIKMPKGTTIRPTKDKVRESLFNIIGELVRDAIVLDGFAGSGAFGIEALSRGAKQVVFIERDKKCVEAINANIASLGINNDNIMILRMDAFRAFDILARKEKKFNIIILDPPYYKELAKKSLIKLDGHDILTFPCVIIAEHYRNDFLPKELDNITCYRSVCYGDTCLSFYKAK